MTRRKQSSTSRKNLTAYWVDERFVPPTVALARLLNLGFAVRLSARPGLLRCELWRDGFVSRVGELRPVRGDTSLPGPVNVAALLQSVATSVSGQNLAT